MYIHCICIYMCMGVREVVGGGGGGARLCQRATLSSTCLSITSDSVSKPHHHPHFYLLQESNICWSNMLQSKRAHVLKVRKNMFSHRHKLQTLPSPALSNSLQNWGDKFKWSSHWTWPPWWAWRCGWGWWGFELMDTRWWQNRVAAGGRPPFPYSLLSVLSNAPSFNILKCKEIVHCCKVRPSFPYSFLSILSDAMDWEIVHCCIVIQTLPHSGPTLSNAVKCTVCIVILPFPYTDPIISNALKSTVLWNCALHSALWGGNWRALRGANKSLKF